MGLIVVFVFSVLTFHFKLAMGLVWSLMIVGGVVAMIMASQLRVGGPHGR